MGLYGDSNHRRKKTICCSMKLNPNWSQVGKAERALIMLASFDAWTLEEVAYLSAGILPPGPNVDYSDMSVQYFSAKKMLIALERAKTCANGTLELSWDGCLIKGEQIGEEVRFSAGDLLTFMCARFGEKSQQRLLNYRRMALEVDAIESLMQFEFSQRPIETPTDTRTGLLLGNGEILESEELNVLVEAYLKFWGPWRNGEKKVPTNKTVEEYLTKGGISGKIATQLASFIRPKDVPRHVPASWVMKK